MKIKGNLKYKRSLFLDEKNLRELNSILLSFFGKIFYCAENIANEALEFDDIEELLTYDNFKERKILKLKIKCYEKTSYSSYAIITIEQSYFLSTSNSYVFSFEYDLESNDNFYILSIKIENFLCKCRNNFLFIRKLLYLLCVVGVILYYTCLYYLEKIKVDMVDMLSICLYISMVLIMLFNRIDKFFIQKLYPSAVFYWGEEIKQYDKKVSLRNYIFWGIIIGIIVSVASAFIYAKISTII